MVGLGRALRPGSGAIDVRAHRDSDLIRRKARDARRPSSLHPYTAAALRSGYHTRVPLTDVERLGIVIRRLHGCESFHVGSVAVTNIRGTLVVQQVEVFALEDHPSAARAYAWTKFDSGGPLYISVLALDPIGTAADAVRGWLRSSRSHVLALGGTTQL